jgi:hypothetical protein
MRADVRAAFAAALTVGVLLASGCTQQSAELAALRTRLAATEGRLQSLEDVNAIEKLNRAYGYYVDKGLWDQVVDLFAENSSVEIEASGVYLGKQGADRLFRRSSATTESALPMRVLFNHPQFRASSTSIRVARRRRGAGGRWRRSHGTVSAHSGTRAYTRTST